MTAERYRLLVEQAPDAILLTDQAGRFVEVNSAACAMLGYSRDELLLLRVPDIVADTDRAEAALQYQSMTPQQGFRAERRLLRKDGTILWADVRAWMTPDGCRQAILRDISERVRAAEQLRTSEQLLTAIISKAPIVLGALNRDGIYTLSLGKSLEALGVPPGALVGQSVWERHGNRPEIREGARRALGGTPSIVNVLLRDSIFETHYEPIFDDHGEVDGAIAVGVDITARVRAEESLRTSREHLLTVVSNVPVVLAAVDRDGVFTLSEGKGLEALGLKSGEVVGVPIWDLYRDNEENLEAARRVLAGESFVTTIRVGDIVFESHYAPIIGSDGEVEGAIAVGIDITARERAIQAQQEADKYLRTVVANLPVVLGVIDRHGVVTLSEGAGLAQLGLQPGEAVGLPISEVNGVEPDLLESARRALAGESFVTTNTIGETIFESHFAPIIGSNGEVDGAIVVSIDITARERAIQAQQAADRYLNTILNAGPAIFVVIDRDGTIKLSEGPLLSRIGGDPGGAVGVSVWERFADNHEQLAAIRRALSGERTSAELNIAGVDLENHFAPTFAANGDITGVVGIGIDVTERNRALQTQKETARNLRAFLNGWPGTFGLIDRDGTYLLSEGRLLSRLGRRPGQSVGSTIWKTYAENPAVVDTVRRSLEGEEGMVEFAVSDIDFEMHFAPTFDDGGEITGAVGIGIDVTERKRAEERFLQAQKMDAIGQLAGGVAHDVNNLMTAIIFNMDLALQEVGTEHAVSADLQDARDIARRAGAMAHQLLAFSRQEIVHPRKLEMNGLVDGVAGMLRRLIGADIELVVRLSLNAGLVRIDATQFEQLLLNLAVNARDAMPGGGILTIATAPSSAGQDGPRLAGLGAGEYACLSVTDTGEGMSEDVREHIFEPFFTTKGPGSGTGLGLAACYGIVKQAGGAIMVESAPGRGSTFSVYLPHVEADSGATVLDVEPALTSLPRGTETILLVEDDASVRRGVARILSALGYAVFEAAHAEEALRVSAQHAGDIALLLTDVVMPGMGGEQLAALLSSERPGLKVLLTSGYAADSPGGGGADARDTKRGRAFLRKPFEPASLAHAVRAALDAPP